MEELSNLLFFTLYDVARVRVDSPIALNDIKWEPQPDITLLRRGVDGHPKPTDIFAVIEVSKFSLRYDSTFKLAKYASEGIPECWIINAENCTVCILRNPQGESFMCDQGYSKGCIAVAAFPKRKFDVKDIFP